MKKSKSYLLVGLASVTVAGMGGVATASPIANGDLVVYRVGTGAAALNSTATAVFVDEYKPNGTAPATLVQSIAMPTLTSGAQKSLLASGSASSEGNLTVSPDGNYVTLTGYGALLGATGVASSTSAATPRVVGLVNTALGTVDTSTALSDAYSGNNIRGAVFDGSNIYVAGAGTAPDGGVRLTTVGATTSSPITAGGSTYNSANGSLIGTTAANFRAVNIFAGQLYGSSQSGSSIGISLLGNSPTAAATNATLIAATGFTSGVSNDYQFVATNLSTGDGTPDTLYVANDNSPGNIQKFSLVGGAYTATGTISVGTGLTGLSGEIVAGQEVLFATTPGAIYTFTDTTGYDGTVSGSATSIVSVGTNEAFRGIAVVPEPASLGALACAGATVLLKRRRKA